MSTTPPPVRLCFLVSFITVSLPHRGSKRRPLVLSLDYIKAEGVSLHRTVIAGARPGLKISWQVTGIRRDPSAEEYSTIPEVEKQAGERGTYLHPEAYGLPPERGVILPVERDVALSDADRLDVREPRTEVRNR